MNSTIRKLVDQLDERTPVPANEIRPPSYGHPQRDAINSVVDGIVGDLCGKIGDLRKILDDLEQQVLEGAAGAKDGLGGLVQTCIRVNDEILHMKEVAEEIRANAPHGK